MDGGTIPEKAEGSGTGVETIKLTDRFDKYFPLSGGQINSGETASVTKSEAELLVQAGAAVRVSVPESSKSDAAKAQSHPPKDKMLKGDTTITK